MSFPFPPVWTEKHNHKDLKDLILNVTDNNKKNANERKTIKFKADVNQEHTNVSFNVSDTFLKEDLIRLEDTLERLISRNENGNNLQPLESSLLTSHKRLFDIPKCSKNEENDDQNSSIVEMISEILDNE